METNNNSKKTEPSLEKSSNILQINICIFLFYSIVFPLLGQKGGMMVSSMFAYGHAAILFLAGVIFLFNEERRSSGAGMILVSLLLAGIGFSFCLGGLELNFH